MINALILGVAERMRELCPDAWLLVVTNPPDIPLAAAHMRFRLTKLIGLCNAPVFNRRMLASFLSCPEEELSLYEIGVNHEYWYYDIRRGGKSVYDELRKRLPKEYEPSAMRGPFHEAFPEWRMGFVNNVELLRLSGYLPGPVGGSNRYRGLPVRLSDMWAVSSRPKDADFEALLAPGLTNEQILEGTRRCAAGLPVYVAGVIESLLTGDDAEHPVLALNCGSLPQYPDDVLLQMTCGVASGGLARPDLRAVPEYIHAVLASRILQNHLMAKSLAAQDEKLAVQSLLVYPERVEGREADGFLSTHKSVEPFIQLD
jgi:alpha-galactosidase/6-phospho-beta-glucosidase family protein